MSTLLGGQPSNIKIRGEKRPRLNMVILYVYTRSRMSANVSSNEMNRSYIYCGAGLIRF